MTVRKIAYVVKDQEMLCCPNCSSPAVVRTLCGPKASVTCLICKLSGPVTTDEYTSIALWNGFDQIPKSKVKPAIKKSTPVTRLTDEEVLILFNNLDMQEAEWIEFGGVVNPIFQRYPIQKVLDEVGFRLSYLSEENYKLRKKIRQKNTKNKAKKKK